MSQDVDLWGDPIPEPAEKRGRPSHEVTEERRLRVAVLRGLNFGQPEIAAAMGISERTLRAKYLPELKHGLPQKRAEVLIRLWGAVEKGNVAAMKEFLRQIEKSDIPGARAPAPARPKPEKLGKKAQAQLDAQTPDTSTSMGELMARRAEGRSVH